MKTTFNDKFIAFLALFAGIAISCVAEFYSIMGLIAIYPAALIPVIIMGAVLGIGKLSATVWLKQSWSWSPTWLKIYILPAIALLMMITSIGVFGFLSKAHSDQSLVSGDVQAQIAIYDEKIQTEKENIDANRKSLKQMDEAVDQSMARSTTEGGADRAVAIRRSQQKERARILADITASQKRIVNLNESRAPIAAEVRKVEAEVGPIKYIAGFIYGSNPDANILEKSVSWVSILIVAVLDPLAIVLLLASQYSFQRIREMATEEPPPDETDDLVDFEKYGFYFDQPRPHETGTDDPIDFPKYRNHFDEPSTKEDLELKEFLDSARETARSIDAGTFAAPDGTPPVPDQQYKQEGGSVTDNELVTINRALSEFVKIFNENKTEELAAPVAEPIPVPAPETVESAPVPAKVIESGNIRRTKVFPRPTPPAEVAPAPVTQSINSPRDYEDGDYVVIKGERFHKKAVPGGYIQNEEQRESNLWSNTVSNNNPQPITPQQYIDTVKKSAE